MAPAIKIVYNGDIYRLRSGETAWVNVLSKANELSGEEGYTLKYTDTDGDQVTLASEPDFLDALAGSPSGLRIHVLPARSKPAFRLITPTPAEVPVSPAPARTPAPASAPAPAPAPAAATAEAEIPAAPPKLVKCTLFRMQPPAPAPEEPTGESEWTHVANDIMSCEGPAGAGSTDENTEHVEDAQEATTEENAPKAEETTATGSEETPKVHVHITCDGCGASPITGSRYKCSECFDFDLCSTCEEANTHDPTHVLIKIRQPLTPGMLAFMMFPPWARGHPGSMHPLHFLLRGAGMGGCPMRGGPRPSHCPRRRGCHATPTDNTKTEQKAENTPNESCKGKENITDQGASSSGNDNANDIPFCIPPWARLPAEVVADMDSALHAMGFGDSRANRRAIYRHGGDMDAIVPALLEFYGY